MIIGSKAFWMALIAVVLFVVKFFAPTFPFDAVAIYSVVVFILSFFGVVPQLRAIRRYALGWSDLFSSAAFWMLLVALISYVIHYYLPTFPITEADLGILVIWILTQVGVNPTVARVKKLLND